MRMNRRKQPDSGPDDGIPSKRAALGGSPKMNAFTGRKIQQAMDVLEKDPDPLGMVHAMKICNISGYPYPEFAIERLATACVAYLDASSRSFDEALGLDPRAAHGKRWRQTEAIWDARHGVQCCLGVMREMGKKNHLTGNTYSETDACQIVADQMGHDATPAKVKRNFLRYRKKR